MRADRVNLVNHIMHCYLEDQEEMLLAILAAGVPASLLSVSKPKLVRDGFMMFMQGSITFTGAL